MFFLWFLEAGLPDIFGPITLTLRRPGFHYLKLRMVRKNRIHDISQNILRTSLERDADFRERLRFLIVISREFQLVRKVKSCLVVLVDETAGIMMSVGLWNQLNYLSFLKDESWLKDWFSYRWQTEVMYSGNFPLISLVLRWSC